MKVVKIYIMSDIQAARKVLEGHSFVSLLVLEYRDSQHPSPAQNRYVAYRVVVQG